ncbi:MAG: hypothetical protein H0U75_12555 [Legionella sp.]|nr:hypothetical protein [Legionella sp.]
MIQLLEGYPSYITQEIRYKHWWNNRIRCASVEELNTEFVATNAQERLLGVLFYISIVGLSLVGLLAFGWVFAIIPLSIFHIPFSLSLYFCSIGAGGTSGVLLGLGISLLHFDAGDNRFEQHRLSSFSKNINVKFDEIR